MGRINTVPRGLQSFLGNSNFGDNPAEMSGVAAPTVAIDRFLEVDQTRSYVSAAVLVAAGNAQVDRIVVPDNELWWVLHTGFFASRTAGAGTGQIEAISRVDNYPGIETGGSPGQFVTIGHFPMITWNNGGFAGGSVWLPKPFPIPAGCGLSWYVGDMNDPANDDFTCRGSAFFYVTKI